MSEEEDTGDISDNDNLEKMAPTNSFSKAMPGIEKRG